MRSARLPRPTPQPLPTAMAAARRLRRVAEHVGPASAAAGLP
eukprot:COSAG04_NODE_17253_length_474_cov_1.096000_1_plen_41_part_01